MFVLLLPSINIISAGEDMTSSLICPCECAMIISTCDCPTALQVKKEISSMRGNGLSENQIFSALLAQYGDIVAHDKAGSTSLWIMGIPLAIILVFVGYIVKKKPNLDIVPDMEKYEKRFEEEYREFAAGMEGT